MTTKLIFIALFALLGLGMFFTSKNRSSLPEIKIEDTMEAEKETSFKASFLIFTNGTRRDFSDERYHKLNDYAYIEPQSHSTIVVKRKVTWGEFFATLPMKVEKNCLTTGTGQEFCNGTSATLKFYINGEKIDNFLGREVGANDKALITFGSENESEIMRQLSKIPDP